ncbi:hypothetical protein [Streptomyces cupreus]|uniref:Uncharacterized protein n=1 Tax=Streptomyces cupreus TaxID=2759956 RepID=A0A7X1J572_9ACTN|nr:hypothetical protein [Streptomyces cupreus]MBC2903904.1 hypothetical protein [Streptomyces cupreus]
MDHLTVLSLLAAPAPFTLGYGPALGVLALLLGLPPDTGVGGPGRHAALRL